MARCVVTIWATWRAVVVVSTTDIWAMGGQSSTASGAVQTLIEQWNCKHNYQNFVKSYCVLQN